MALTVEQWTQWWNESGDASDAFVKVVEPDTTNPECLKILMNVFSVQCQIYGALTAQYGLRHPVVLAARLVADYYGHSLIEASGLFGLDKDALRAIMVSQQQEKLGL